MSFTYMIDPKAMFEDRFNQFVSFGIPRADAEVLRDTITDMWTDAPGGWPFEWSAYARKYMEDGDPLLSSIAYGCAKFPCLANDTRRRALQNQLVAYLTASTKFPVHFERRIIRLPYQGQIVDLPVHLFSQSGQYANKPVLLYSGGVDTYKMDSHPFLVTLAQRLDATVLAFDQPGTAENPIPLCIEGDELILALVKEARKLGNGKVIHFGLSFGGNFSAMTGLSGAVDAAIVLGGPVDRALERENAEALPYGMAGIIGNDMGFDHEPSMDEFVAGTSTFSRHTLLNQDNNAPMLVINGGDDVFVPQSDTLVFEGRKDTDVYLIPGTGHCALSKFSEALDLILTWVSKQIGSKFQSPLPIANPESVGFSSELLDRMDEAMKAETDAAHYAGISVMVARHGKLVKSGYYGYQSLESRIPLREDAIFRIASMTKPIIAAAMMTLFEEGKWQLDDEVTKFIPEFVDLQVLKEDKLVPLDRPMTLRHLMSTSAGFAFGPLFGSTNPKVDALYSEAGLWSGTNDEMIAKLAKLPLEAQPGTEFRYGLQQEVQGAIIRRISGEGLDTFLQKRIFAPLGMRDTGFGVAENQRDRIPPRYALDENLKLVLAQDQSAFPALAGTPAGVTPKMLLSIAGLYSTLQDYIRFAQMLANRGELDGTRILSPSSVKLMTSNLLEEGVKMRFLKPFTGVGYGMNLGIVLDPAHADFNGGPLGVGTFYWGGVHGTWFWVDPANDIVVVGMVQQQDAGNPGTGRPYPMPDIRAISRSITYGALIDPAL